jgi:putative glycosyltransferase (TIGR04372 family)
MKPLAPEPGIIDYAHSSLRCDWLDVFLCASCRFFLGGASGLCLVATVFGVPSAVANQALPVLTHAIGKGDLLIPKLLWSSKLGRHLTLPEIASSPFANARLAHCFEHTGIEVRDNDPQDIQDLALEMLAEVEGSFVEDDEDRRVQASFQALVRPGHYSYGAVSRFGRCFVRKYRHLLGPVLAKPVEFRGALPGCGTLQCGCLPADWLPDPPKIVA